MTDSALPTVRATSPADMLDLIPYLLGFRPEESLVAMAINDGVIAPIARIDLTDDPIRLSRSVLAIAPVLRRVGAQVMVAIITENLPGADPRQHWRLAGDILLASFTACGLEVLDLMLVSDSRWWSLFCTDPDCCPAAGNLRASSHGEVSAAVASAVSSGLAPQPSRAAAVAPLDRLDEVSISAVRPLLEDAERRLQMARDANRLPVVLQRDRDLLLSEIRRHAEDQNRRLSYQQLARLAVALREHLVRDKAWEQVDARLVDLEWMLGDMACRLPEPYRAAPLFLWGWQRWRHGDSALAGEAADRALLADPDYPPAHLLVRVISAGLNPRSVPSLIELAGSRP